MDAGGSGSPPVAPWRAASRRYLFVETCDPAFDDSTLYNDSFARAIFGQPERICTDEMLCTAHKRYDALHLCNHIARLNVLAALATR